MSREFSNHVYWSDLEIETLNRIYPLDVEWSEIKEALPGRSDSSIQGKANGLGIMRPKKEKMSDAERLKRKRESMAARRLRDPEAVREYQNSYHIKNRDAQCEKMRKYYKKRFFWGKAMKLRGDNKASARDIASVWKSQRGLCALTGRRLDRTAHLDHIMPKARGGKDYIANLRWLSPEANLCSRDLTDDEFISLCSDVMKWIGERITLFP